MLIWFAAIRRPLDHEVAGAVELNLAVQAVEEVVDVEEPSLDVHRDRGRLEDAGRGGGPRPGAT